MPALQVLSDRGNEFAGAFAGLQVHNVKHIQSRPHSPWTNGRVERMVETTRECICKDWQLLIPYLQNTINARAAKSTGLVPLEIFLGEAGHPLVDNFAAVLNGKLQEADPRAVKEFGQWVRGKL